MSEAEIFWTILILLGMPVVVWAMLTPHEPGWLKQITHRDEAIALMAGWTDSGRTGDGREGDRWRVSVGALRFLTNEFTFEGMSTGATVCVSIPGALRKAERNVVGKVKSRMYAKAREQGVKVRVRVIERPYGVDVEGVLLRA